MLNIIHNDINNIDIDLSKMKNKSVLITGASGLIGLYMLAVLKRKQKEYNISIYTINRNKINDIYLPLFEDCYRIIADITDNSIYETLPKFDYIIHAAGYGQPGKFMLDKIKTIKLNTTSTIKLLEKLNIDGTFLFVSTSELYSGLELYNITENEIGNTNTNHPRSCYIEGKRCGESICHSYIENGVDVKIARLSLAYGPGTQIGDARVLNSLIEKGIKNTEIKLMDGGQAIRTYCYITDTIEMFLNILLFGKEHTYNVGGKSTTTILDLANMIAYKLNKKVITPTIVEELVGNPKIVNISIDKYINEFDKISFISLNDGLDNTIKWQKKLYK